MVHPLLVCPQLDYEDIWAKDNWAEMQKALDISVLFFPGQFLDHALIHRNRICEHSSPAMMFPMCELNVEEHFNMFAPSKYLMKS